MSSPLMAYGNDEWRHFVVRIRSPAIISFYCVCFLTFYFFLFKIFCWFYYLLRYWYKFVNTWNKAVDLFLGSSQGFSRGELLQPYLIINVTGLVKIEEINIFLYFNFKKLYLTSTYLSELLVADLLIVNNSILSNLFYLSVIYFFVSLFLLLNI